MQEFGITGDRKAGPDEFYLLKRNELAVFFLKIGKLNSGKKLKCASEPAVEPLCSFRNAPDHAVIACEKYDYAVCLGQVIAFQDKALGFK